MELGTKVTANWGAMFPTQDGEVVAIENSHNLIVHNSPVAVIQFEDDPFNFHRTDVSEIHEPGWRSANGSPIGIFLRSE